MTTPTDDKLERALRQFDPYKFVYKHRGRKESPSPRTHEWLLDCPGCGSSRLRWNSVKHTWICWGCKVSGDTLKLIQIMERVDELGAMRYLLDGYVGGDAKIDSLESIMPASSKPSTQALRTLPTMQWPRGVDVLAEGFEPHDRGWSYLLNRGVTARQIKRYRVGFGREGRLANYVVFPCFVNHRFVYYQGRATWDPPEGLTDEERKRWIENTGYRKTLNPYHRKNEALGHEVIFGFDQARTSTSIVVCEGPIDALKVGPNAVAMLGKDPDPVKIQRLSHTYARQFIVYLDAGEHASAERLAQELSAFGEVFVAFPPKGEDPGSLSPAENHARLALAQPFTSKTLKSGAF